METIRLGEIYLSIQGESTFAGRPCVLVRTTGCPLRCAWCDSAFAFEGGEDLAIDEIVRRVQAYGVPLVEVTGGEPLAQTGTLALLTRLADQGFTVLLETGGSLDIAPVDPRVHVILDVKCPDSGMSDRMHRENLARLETGDEVKFVVASRRDFEFARDVVFEHGLAERCEVLFSPAFDRMDRRVLADWVIEERLPVRFQLQMHKFIWPPDMRGV